MQIHHYTKASTLPLILKNGTIRFTRSDCLDDIEELAFKASHISRNYFFISSWVKSEIENSGQWFRYADQHRGVRISFESEPFPVEELTLEVSRPYISSDGSSNTLGINLLGAKTPFTKETMFGQGFVLIPWGERGDFGGDVTYVANPTANMESFISSNQESTNILEGSKFARIKSSPWNDQLEYRVGSPVCFDGNKRAKSNLSE